MVRHTVQQVERLVGVTGIQRNWVAGIQNQGSTEWPELSELQMSELY